MRSCHQPVAASEGSDSLGCVELAAVAVAEAAGPVEEGAAEASRVDLAGASPRERVVRAARELADPEARQRVNLRHVVTRV